MRVEPITCYRPRPELASEFGVQSIPTLIVFKAGQVADRAVGVRNAADLRRMLGL